MLKFFFCSAFALASFAAWAVEPREWTSSFYACKNASDQSGVPVLLVWGNDGCPHCETLTEKMATPDFIAWMAEGPELMFCHVIGSGSKEAEDAYEFARYANHTISIGLSEYPFVCVYVPEKGTGGFTAVNFVGRDQKMPVKIGELDHQLMSSVEQVLGFTGDSCVAFPMGDTENDCLEAIVGSTKWVDVPLVRTNQVMRMARTKLQISCGDQATTVETTWANGDVRKMIRYELPQGFSLETPVTLTLVDFEGAELGVRHIWPVAADRENSPKNPFWLGEKTVDSLGWGEWTMDLDVVTNKINAFNAANPGERAYAMVLVGGSTWCPDCAMADANVFEKQEFKDWAVKNKVVFGVLDIPNNPQVPEANPSQLRYESARASDAFVTLRGTAPADETQRYQSGAGYLSRHSVPYEDALDIAERNAFLVGHNTLNGGWNRPERENQNRTGVPMLILLRDDGTIAARWNRFSDVGPEAFEEGYLCRFEEMLAQVDDETEESNDDPTTTTLVLGLEDGANASLSAVDGQDVYVIDAPKNTLMTFVVTGTANVPFTLTVTDDSGAVSETLATKTGLLDGNVSVSVKLTSDRCHLRVGFPKDKGSYATSGFFAVTNTSWTVCDYHVTSSGVMSGGEIGFAKPVIEATEGGAGETSKVAIVVCRINGARGATSVKVALKSVTGETDTIRHLWTDQILSWGANDAADKTAYLTIIGNAVAERDMSFGFALTDFWAEADDAKLRDGATEATVHVYDDDVFGTLLYKGVAVSQERTIPGYEAGDVLQFSKWSGSMPAGLCVTVCDGSLVASGLPSKAGEYAVTYDVSIVRKGVVVGSTLVTFEFTVRDVDFAAKLPSLVTGRTYRNLPVVDSSYCQGDSEIGDRHYVTGLLTLTVPSNGRLSARYVTGWKAYSYSASGWSDYQETEPASLTAVLTRTDDHSKTLTVQYREDGAWAELDGCYVELPLLDWSAAHSAAKWRGQYTAHLVQTNSFCAPSQPRIAADAYMAMRMITSAAERTGAMLYAGILPNGQPFSGSSVLVEKTTSARLPVFHFGRGSGLTYVFSGCFEIKPNAERDYQSDRWSISSPEDMMPCWKLAEDGTNFAASDLLAYGSYYDSSEIFARASEDFAGRSLELSVASETILSGRYGQALPIIGVAVQVTEDNDVKLVPGAENPQEVALKFSPVTGIVSGSFRLPFAVGDLAVSYRGIVLPGWGGCSICVELPERPLAVGVSSFADRDAAGPYRSGCVVKIGPRSEFLNQ